MMVASYQFAARRFNGASWRATAEGNCESRSAGVNSRAANGALPLIRPAGDLAVDDRRRRLRVFHGQHEIADGVAGVV